MKLIGDEKLAFLSKKNLIHNLNIVRNEYPGMNIIGVVKSNAYGHDAKMFSHILFENGIKTIAVATLDEAEAIAEINKELDILILGYTSPERLRVKKNNKIIQTINSLSYYEEIKEIEVRKQVNVNTGMNRLGIKFDNMNLELSENLKIEGIFTHFFNNKDDVQTTNQLEKFYKVNCNLVRHTNIANYSVLKQFGIKSIRVGLSIYGYENFIWAKKLKPVMTLCAKIIKIEKIKQGESISYNAKYIAQKDIIVGTVAIGYADGIPFNYTDGFVFYKNKRCKILGRITMDYIMIDLNDLESKEYDYVEIFGENISAEEVAEKSETIVYEILTRVGNRVKRIYTF